MNIRALTIAAGLVAAGSANAALIGFEARSIGDTGYGERFEIYALFDEASVILNVFDAAWVSDGNFHQSGAPFGSDTAPNSGFFSFDPSLPSDSFVTIGVTDSAVSTDISTDPAFVFGANTVSGGWFDGDPGSQDGATDGANEVFLGQLTIVGGARGDSGPMSGTAGVTFFDAGGGTVQQVGAFVPTPGAMALFGLAGLTAGRRRR
ncbi:MAG: hypothetical protein ACYTF7_10800 [Planctomycetota bacterium]|jgi:MYXO-CTERM domain-containing protein